MAAAGTETKDPRDAAFEDFLAGYREREMLRFLTCGSVDDGKSTLIGRLLHDSQMVYEDQLAALRKDSARHGTTGDDIDLALLVDGLAAEREQGITIDVAYRYFATPKRKFIIADTPGHEQYTRNMATGASTCNLAIILVDARKGVVEQTRRHSFIATLLGIKHLVVAVNKMDLVEWSEERYEEIRAAFSDFAAKLQVTDVEFIPMSALKGDNVVRGSERMPWYQGRPLLDQLENVHIASDRNLIDLRLPVQLVVRPNLDFRGFAGTLASGILRVGEEVLALPSGRRSRVKSLASGDTPVDEAFAPMSVMVTLEDELDVSRGDMFVPPNNVPHMDHTLEAMVVWMNDAPLQVGTQYLMKQATLQTPAIVTDLRYRINVSSVHREPASELRLNEIGRIRVESPRLIAYDSYAKNRTTGAFILIDRLTNATLAAGMILDRETADGVTSRRAAPDAGSNLREGRGTLVKSDERASRLQQRPLVVWLTGLPRSGKSSIAWSLERRLFDEGYFPHVIDGEDLRHELSSDLGFSVRDRSENVRRAAILARRVADLGIITIVAMVSPSREDRAAAREIIGAERFVEVFCNAPLEVCEQRDDEGLFERARAGEIQNVSGVDATYEEPETPHLALDTVAPLESTVEALTAFLRNGDWLRRTI